jgi:hypothetical protein
MMGWYVQIFSSFLLAKHSKNMAKFSECQLEQLKELFKTCVESKFKDWEETKSNDQLEQLNDSAGLLVRLHRAQRAHGTPASSGNSPGSRFDVPRDPLSTTLESHLANTKIARF